MGNKSKAAPRAPKNMDEPSSTRGLCDKVTTKTMQSAELVDTHIQMHLLTLGNDTLLPFHFRSSTKSTNLRLEKVADDKEMSGNAG